MTEEPKSETEQVSEPVEATSEVPEEGQKLEEKHEILLGKYKELQKAHEATLLKLKDGQDKGISPQALAKIEGLISDLKTDMTDTKTDMAFLMDSIADEETREKMKAKRFESEQAKAITQAEANRYSPLIVERLKGAGVPNEDPRLAKATEMWHQGKFADAYDEIISVTDAVKEEKLKTEREALEESKKKAVRESGLLSGEIGSPTGLGAEPFREIETRYAKGEITFSEYSKARKEYMNK